MHDIHGDEPKEYGADMLKDWHPVAAALESEER